MILEDILSQNRSTIEAVQASDARQAEERQLFRQEIRGRLGTLETAVRGHGEGICRVEAKVDQLASRVETVESKVDRIESRVDKIESKVDRIESRVDKIESKVDRIESRVDKIESKVDRIESDVAELKTGLARVEAKVDTLAPLEGRVADLERRRA